jgi:hypothetical protein
MIDTNKYKSEGERIIAEILTDKKNSRSIKDIGYSFANSLKKEKTNAKKLSKI